MRRSQNRSTKTYEEESEYDTSKSQQSHISDGDKISILTSKE
jgi:hypothetical protein